MLFNGRLGRAAVPVFLWVSLRAPFLFYGHQLLPCTYKDLRSFAVNDFFSRLFLKMLLFSVVLSPWCDAMRCNAMQFDAIPGCIVCMSILTIDLKFVCAPDQNSKKIIIADNVIIFIVYYNTILLYCYYWVLVPCHRTKSIYQYVSLIYTNHMLY